MKSIVGAVAVLAVVFTACGGDDASGTCTTEGTGSLAVVIDAPAGATGSVVITLPDGSKVQRNESGTVDIAAGPASFEARRTRSPGDVVGTTYVGRVDTPQGCVRAGSTLTVRATYEKDPASERLYVADGQGTQILGFGRTQLMQAGNSTPTPEFVLKGSLTAPKSLAFGVDGTLWVIDAQRVIAFKRESLVTSGSPEPDIVLEGDDVAGSTIPGPAKLAFDSAGYLWIANTGLDRVSAFAPDAIRRSGSPTAAVTIAVQDPLSLAFVSSGAFWVGTADDKLLFFDGHGLLSNLNGAAPEIQLVAKTPGPSVNTLNGPEGLAIDANGDFWVAYATSGALVRLLAAERAATGEVTPARQIVGDVLGLPNGIAFDEGGAVWIAGKQGTILRISSDQLAATTSPTIASTLSPVGLSYAEVFAFNPPPASVPVAF